MPSSSCLSLPSPSWSGNKPISPLSSLSPYLSPGLFPIPFTYLSSQTGSTVFMGPATCPTLCCSWIIINFTKDGREAETRRDLPLFLSPARNAAPVSLSGILHIHYCLALSHLICPHLDPMFHISILLRIMKRWQHNPKIYVQVILALWMGSPALCHVTEVEHAGRGCSTQLWKLPRPLCSLTVRIKGCH